MLSSEEEVILTADLVCFPINDLFNQVLIFYALPIDSEGCKWRKGR